MTTFKLDKYRTEAQVPPFELELAEGQTILIDPPDGEAMMVISETPIYEARTMLRSLCGDHYDDLWAVLGKEQASVVTALIVDMVKHFKIGDLGAASGGLRALPR